MKTVALSQGWLREEIMAALDKMIDTSYVPEETKRLFENAREEIGTTRILEVGIPEPTDGGQSR
jgi:hypothetical protein